MVKDYINYGYTKSRLNFLNTTKVILFFKNNKKIRQSDREAFTKSIELLQNSLLSGVPPNTFLSTMGFSSLYLQRDGRDHSSKAGPFICLPVSINLSFDGSCLSMFTQWLALSLIGILVIELSLRLIYLLATYLFKNLPWRVRYSYSTKRV